MSYDLEKIFKDLEDYLIASMKRNLRGHELEEEAEGFSWEAWQAKKLRELTKFKKRNRKYFEKIKIDKLTSAMLREQFLEGGKKTDKEFSAMIKKGLHLKRMEPTNDFFAGDNNKLNALIKSVSHDMKNAGYAALRQADDVYRKALYQSVVYAGSGTKTVAQAVDMATKEFLSKGITCIRYANGANVNITSYCNMAIRTANKRAHLMGEGERRKEWGESRVLVSQYLQCSPTCLPWQNHIYIDDVYSGGKAEDGDYPLLSNAIAGGLFH
jgi:hypothetical protein